MDLRRLGHFSVLADELSFRVASSRLHLTQPALTRSIASLERDLGVRLFDRDKRHVALTPEGAALLDRARALLRDADALARVASDLRPERRRELRIGCYGTALAELTYPVLRTFSDRHPDVSLTVSDVTFDRGIEPLLTGEVDIALLRAPCEVPSLTTVPLFTEPASVQLCAEHRLASERSVDVCDLLDDPWNALPLTTPDKWNRYFTCVEQRGGEAPLIGGRGRTIAEAASLVAFKQIVALVPGSTARQRHSGVSAVSVRGVEPFRVGVAYPRSKPAALTEAFVAVATDVTRHRLSLVPGSETLI